MRNKERNETPQTSPLLLLTNKSKFFWKTMYSRLQKFLDKFDYLYKKQYGFSKFPLN